MLKIQNISNSCQKLFNEDDLLEIEKKILVHKKGELEN